MIRKPMKFLLLCICIFIYHTSFSQLQSCPVNINFSSGNLTHWFAYTGNNGQNTGNPNGGNGPLAIKVRYDSTVAAPAGTIGAVTIPEYQLPSVNGIRVITSQSTDFYGGFSTIPTINGYPYDYSILIGSTSITHSNANGGPSPGGYIRGISYVINVPAQPATQPYTMTYAYAMVLENGAHNPSDQPHISVSLNVVATNTNISCASASDSLPTVPGSANANGGGALLDSAAAFAEGFKLSPQPSPNADPNGGPNAEHLKDVWTKNWTEVTFDLSPYRGQQVSLTFEADNCVPGGHFAYGYIAVRNTCAGLQISGDTLACANTNLTYSVPALAGATYTWTVPPSWTIVPNGSDLTTNIINVTTGNGGGTIIAHEQNGCANLADTINVATTPPTIPGSLSSNATVCADNNSSVLLLAGNNGNVIKWIESTDSGATFTDIPDKTPTYTAQNLGITTLYEALVQNTAACDIDTSSAVIITVDKKSVGGNISPDNFNFCAGQDIEGLFTLTNNVGSVVNWQSSTDSVNWFNILPPNTDSVFNIGPVAASTYYRTIVKNGVCVADTSSVAEVKLYPAPFPKSVFEPADTTICYGGIAKLNALISIGTNYSWTNTGTLTNQGNGNIASTPYIINASAKPLATTDYVLSIQNTGCPNALLDTFHINVIPPILLNAGNDTSVVVNQPLQFHATTNDSSVDTFLWTPVAYLNNPNISNPIGIFGSEVDSVRYIVRATDSLGCYAEDDILVKVFKTAPDIFVPNAFTPGGATNNVFRPIAVGISSLDYFRIYNRWGQLVYTTSRLGDGWNGTFDGKPQDTGTFVWMVQGTTYTNKKITEKGTMTLIR
jgi:gliding motility-associated-like protein